jgi:alkylation response protein AidB-like acyl-CoA dehydrogenase
MELNLTEDQELFRETTERFLTARSPATAVRSLRDSADGFDRDYWREGAALGWVSLLVPEALGGGSVSGAGIVDLTIVADAFGGHAAPGPLLPTNVVAAAIAQTGTEDQRDSYLAGLLAGDLIASWCVGRPTPDGTMTSGISARRDGDSLVLSGSEALVESAAQADLLLVTAQAENGPTQVLLSSEHPGLTIVPLVSLDLTRRFGAVTLTDARVPLTAILGGHGEAAEQIERQLQLGLVIQAAESAGAAQRVFDFTLQWAFDRYSFGRPLASCQEIKHRFADMKTWLEASHAMVTAAARAVQRQSPDAASTASVAAAYLGDVLPELIQDCVQIHGGIGVTYDHDLHLFLRRVTVNRALHGTPADHRQRLATFDERAHVA